MMTKQDFYEFQTAVEASAVSYENQPDGSTVVTCEDGARIRVDADGDSQEISAGGDVMETPLRSLRRRLADVM